MNTQEKRVMENICKLQMMNRVDSKQEELFH